jgi:predicted N-acyltransferase
MSTLSVKANFSIHEIHAGPWNELSDGIPFQSHRWHAFGERVVSDCSPVYLLAYDGNRLIARASLWLVRNEPLPKSLGPLRGVARQMIRHWPLLICRSPLSYASGLVVADERERSAVLTEFAVTAKTIAKQLSASFIIFDYLSKANTQQWPDPFSAMQDVDPGTSMENKWASLDEYLSAGDKKDRQHYKRVLREAGKLGIKIERHNWVDNIDAVLPLIRSVEQGHGALANPWAGAMLEHMQMVDGSFLTATIDKQIVGCGLILEDNGCQMTSLLGLAKDIPYVYFMLVYESLRMAFEHKVRLLRWGSGAYDMKQRLGFSLEDNSSLVFTAVNPWLQNLLLRFS